MKDYKRFGKAYFIAEDKNVQGNRNCAVAWEMEEAIVTQVKLNILFIYRELTEIIY